MKSFKTFINEQKQKYIQIVPFFIKSEKYWLGVTEFRLGSEQGSDEFYIINYDLLNPDKTISNKKLTPEDKDTAQDVVISFMKK